MVNCFGFFSLPDQQIYTASQYEFRSFPDIRRNSPSPTLKTEDAPTRWLNGELISWHDKSSFSAFGWQNGASGQGFEQTAS